MELLLGLQRIGDSVGEEVIDESSCATVWSGSCRLIEHWLCLIWSHLGRKKQDCNFPYWRWTIPGRFDSFSNCSQVCCSSVDIDSSGSWFSMSDPFTIYFWTVRRQERCCRMCSYHRRVECDPLIGCRNSSFSGCSGPESVSSKCCS